MSDYYRADTGEQLTDYEAHELFDEYLDEVLEDVKLGELTYTASDVLKNCDPIAYRCEFSDWTSERENGLVESGYWVDVLTEDGEVYEAPEWFTDEDEARETFTDHVNGLAGTDAVPVTVRLYDTAGDMMAESRVSA